MKIGDRVKITKHSKYHGRTGTISHYAVSTDCFKVLIDDPRPFVVPIWTENLEPHKDFETFDAEEFDSIFS